MNKMNKKGFTLIEMLVVIAIIAILVSIIVPVVGNSTEKAAAATNAANLRSMSASIAIKVLEGSIKVTSTDGSEEDITSQVSVAGLTVPTAKKVNSLSGGDFKAVVKNGEVICTFGSNTVDDYGDIADNGKDDNSNVGNVAADSN